MKKWQIAALGIALYGVGSLMMASIGLEIYPNEKKKESGIIG